MSAPAFPPVRWLPVAACLIFSGVGRADPAPTKIIPDLAYKDRAPLTDSEKERCKLDLYLPNQRTGFPSLVWFHGGGLTAGNKKDLTTIAIARVLNRAGIAVAVANYRLNPQATFPAYVQDAAAAFAWVHDHIAQYGGDPAKVFMGGHSAGAYLTSLVAMDPRYLKKFGLDQTALAGLVPVSGQMLTHFTVRKERGIADHTVTADEAAPIYYSRKETPPFLIIFGDHDWPARLEENQYFAAMQRSLGNRNVELDVFKERDHGSIVNRMAEPDDPAMAAIIAFIRRVSAERSAPARPSAP